jgi:Uri superfamily endonuclease
VGNKGIIDFRKGFYAYVGSALSGLESRLGRHLSPVKKFHWHVDFFLGSAVPLKIIYAETMERKECALARTLSLALPSVAGFGSSDCKCPSHLFFSRDRGLLEKFVIGCFKSSRLTPVIFYEKG